MKKILLVAFLTFAAAFTPIAAKYTVAQISPLSLAFLRFGMATALLLLVCAHKKVNLRIEKEDFAKFLFTGFLVIPFNQIVFLVGIKLSAASHSGVLYSCTPMIVYVCSIFLKHEKFQLKKIFTISLTIIGIFLIFYENIVNVNKDGNEILIGDILLFFAVLSFGMYLAFSKNLIVKYGSLKAQTLSFSIGSIMYIPIFLYDIQNVNFSGVNFYGWLGYIHLTFIVAFASYFLYSYTTKFIHTSTLTTLTNMAPVFTLIFSWILLKESLSYFFIIGAVITFIGVFLTQLMSRARKNEPVEVTNL
ncbi:MAG: DMT family transporter [Ignavibacteria bacterium]|nr:DMT family transporter [Ignavibacteria bacterium]